MFIPVDQFMNMAGKYIYSKRNEEFLPSKIGVKNITLDEFDCYYGEFEEEIEDD